MLVTWNHIDVFVNLPIITTHEDLEFPSKTLHLYKSKGILTYKGQPMIASHESQTAFQTLINYFDLSTQLLLTNYISLPINDEYQTNQG